MRTINNYDYIVIDLESGIARDINTINNFCGSTATYEIIPIFGFSLTGTPHIGYPIDWFGNPWDLGTKTFYWDGSGKILLASSPYAFNPKDQISAMGEIKVKSTFGSTSFNPEKPEDTLVSGPDLEITQILMPGVENTVNVSIIASGTRHGSSALWLIQVITTPLNRPINITDITDITNDSNDDSFSHKIYELGTGITEVISGIYFYRTSNNRENTYYWQKVGNDLIDKGWDRASNALNSMWG
jgi:hypothetical protein